MSYIPLEKLLSSHGSLYKLVMAGAKRVTELSQGMLPLIQSSSKKITSIALEEIAAGKVCFKPAEIQAVSPHAKKTKDKES